jgi:hypothetical protein
VFFGATQQSERVELRRLLEAVGRDLGSADYDLAGGQFLDWEAALRYLVRLSHDQLLLVVLDEVPYLARSTPGFASIVQVVSANRAGQRIDRALDVLLRAGFVARQVPVGAPKGANPTYAIPDPYLRFWFDVLYADLALGDAGLGDAVLSRAQSRWTRHVAGVFEDAARQHARSLVTAGRLPDDVVVGRWWSSSGPSIEIDVLGLQGKRTVIGGEAKWLPSKLGWSEVNGLQSASHAPLPYRRLPNRALGNQWCRRRRHKRGPPWIQCRRRHRGLMAAQMGARLSVPLHGFSSASHAACRCRKWTGWS